MSTAVAGERTKPVPHRISRDFRLPVKLCAFSSRRTLYWLALALSMIVGRIAVLPLIPVPDPKVHDEFSYLLGADTFAQGRLANPPLQHPEFFEAPHILTDPVYISKYPPGQALILAIGRRLTGYPYAGVVLSTALMVFLFCWAANAWLPPQWTLIAGCLSTVFFFLRHYWFTSYWGGSVAACGGALVVGGLGYALRGRLKAAKWSLAPGAVVLYGSRPYEGGILCLAVLIILATVVVRLPAEKRRALIRSLLPASVAILAAAAVLAGWYNWRVTGRVTQMPYFLYVQQKDIIPTLWPFPMFPPKQYSNGNTEALHQWELDAYRSKHRMALPVTLGTQVLFFIGSGIAPQFSTFGFLFLGIPWARIRGRTILLVLMGVCVAALLPEVFIQAHYTAPFTIVELILVVAAARALWYRMAASRARGILFLLAMVMLVTPVVLDYAVAAQAHPSERSKLVHHLESAGGRHLVFVDYEKGWDFLSEWVYNGADPNRGRVIFAHRRSDPENRSLMKDYPDRKAWLVRLGPESMDVRLEPYPGFE